jgi:UDP-glucose 6-dehydrogenase
MNISIFRLGYVGTVCAACLAERGQRIMRVLTKDRSKNGDFGDEAFKVVVQVMIQSQRQIDHFLAF